MKSHLKSVNVIFKKDKKRVQKFVQLLKKNIIHKYKLNYYLRFISRAIMQSEKLGNIRIESLHSTAKDEFTISDCPEILLTLGNTDKKCID